MTDKTELKRLADSANAVTGDVFVDIAISSERGPNQPEIDAVKAFVGVATPAAVLALIAENEAMAEFKAHMVSLRETSGFDSWAAVLVELDRLKAENEALRNALRPLLAHWDDLKAGESLNVDAASAAMGNGEQS